MGPRGFNPAMPVDEFGDPLGVATNPFVVVPELPVPPVTSRFSRALINCSSAGANVLIAGTPGQTIRVFAMDLVLNNTDVIKLTDETGDLTGPMRLQSYVKQMVEDPWFETVAGDDFILNMTTGTQAGGVIWYKKG